MERIRYTHHKDLFFLELLNFVEFEAGLVGNSGSFASDFLDFFNILQLEEDGIGFEEEENLRLVGFNDSKFVAFGDSRIWGFVDLKIVDKGLAMVMAIIRQICNRKLTVSSGAGLGLNKQVRLLAAGFGIKK